MTATTSTASTPPRPVGVSGWIAARASILLSSAVLFALALKLFLVFRIDINWDEFYYLSFVQDYLRGTMSDRFQTLHVHLFAWLPSVATGEIGQILLARVVMAGCAIGSALLLYGIARRFLSRESALFGLLGYLSSTSAIEHGTSFRTDSIATFLVLLALFLILRRPGGQLGAILAGAAMAVAMLITVKAAFYVALMAPVIWCVGSGWRNRVGLALAFGLSLGLAFAALYGWHVSTLALPPAADAANYLRGTASKVFFEDGLVPRWRSLIDDMARNPLFWILTGLGAFVALQAIRASRANDRKGKWLPLLLALPILTPLFYRNAFAYYYALILPPAAILIGLAYDRCRQRLNEAGESRSLRLLSLLILLQAGFPVLNAATNLPDAIEPQRRTLNAVHAIFPEPVPYIDGYGVVSSFPRTGFFMSSWGMDKYREAGMPVFRELVEKAQPPLLLADSPSLYAALVPDVTVVPQRALLPADIAFLKDNYLQHWGMIFVAGKEIELSASVEETPFEIAIGGGYRLEADTPMLIDGIMRKPGDVVFLAIGDHSLDAGPGTDHVSLRWAAALPPPASNPTDIWTFFATPQ